MSSANPYPQANDPEEELSLRDAARVIEASKTHKGILYDPYPKQKLFHDLGKTHRERCLQAANKVGKTFSASREVYYHARGEYPEWWEGRRFHNPVKIWAAGKTNVAMRGTVQEMLLGPHEPYGTGAIPARYIEKVVRARSIPELVDIVFVKHVTGGVSMIEFKSYALGVEPWMGPNIDFIWFDEEPPLKIWSEGLMRTAQVKGSVMLTHTPLLGQTEVVEQFWPEPTSPYRALVMMDFDDADHFRNDPEQKAAVLAGVPEYEIDARSKGIPMLGEGRIFNIAEESLMVEPFKIPDHFHQIGGMDFGWTHPTAAVWMAIDRDSDTFYIIDCYRQAKTVVPIHASRIRSHGTWIPWAWPHDGYETDKQSGAPTKDAYRREGIKMLETHATFIDGKWGVEAGLLEILNLMHTDRFKVFNTCSQWFEEFRSYHRQDGKIVKRHDDLMAATRYAYMMNRFARQNLGYMKVPANVSGSYDPFAYAQRGGGLH